MEHALDEYDRSARAVRPPVIEIEAAEERPRRFGDYVGVVRRNACLILGCLGATLALTVIVTFLMPRRYTASVRLQVSHHAPIQLHLEKNVLSVDDGDRTEHGDLAFLATHVAALQSRDLAERVIKRHGLASSPAFLEPGRRSTTVLPVPRSMRPLLRPADPASFPLAARDDGLRDPNPVDPALLDRYLEYLTVREVPGTNLLDVSFTTPSARLSAFLAAAHADAYLEANEDVRRATDVVARGFLERKLADSRRQLKHAEAELSGFAAGHPEVAVDQENKIGGQRVAELSTELTKVETERIDLESRYQFLADPKSDPLAYFLKSPGVEKLRLALLDVQAQKAALDERLGENHPRMVELKRLETQLGEQLRGEVERDVGSVRAHYDAARQRETQIRRKLDEQQRAGTSVTRLGARYELLKNDVEAARGLHTSLLQQQMATAANSDLAATNISVVERADLPRWPSRPKIPLNLALGMAGGLVVAFGAALAKDYFDHSVKSTEEIEALLQLPTLATIPNFGLARRPVDPALALPDETAAPGREIVVVDEPDSVVAEAFRSMRTAILLSANGPPPRVILLTSARAAEGKTVASLNLATALVQAGARVLLVEADLRHPRCHDALGTDNTPGLAAYLSGAENELQPLIRAVSPPGLFFLPSGAPPANPAELIGSPRMRIAIRALRIRYDFVIIDTPPAGPVTDAALLAREADGVILVVKGGLTPRELVRRTRDRLVQTGARFLGVIVNDVGLDWTDGYFYGSYYGYPGRGPSDGNGDGDEGDALGVAAAFVRERTWRPAVAGTAEFLRSAARLARGGRAG
jgi:polysaccharide biosynthesis transport protein